MKVLVTEAIGQQGLDILGSVAPVDIRLGLNGAALAEAIKDYGVLVVRSQTQVTADIIACADSLRIIGRCGVGVDNIDVEAATRRGVLVVNSPSGNTLAAAEHTVSLLFALARHLPDAVASMRRGEWDRKRFVGSFVTALMTFLWVYEEGQLEGPDKLVLRAKGPNMGPGGGMANYRDEIEFVTPDERLLRSFVEGPAGTWTQFMQARYRRR